MSGRRFLHPLEPEIAQGPKVLSFRSAAIFSNLGQGLGQKDKKKD